MRVSAPALLVAAAVAVSAGEAPVVASNPIGAIYTVTFPNKETTAIRGEVTGSSAPDGKGVTFQVAISGLPAEGGPFMYHIHEKPVPADGNCTGTGAHLDPYKAGETPACDASKPETCQTGDLSGKYGNLTGLAGSKEYLDLYSSTDPSDPAYFGKLSIVVHSSNKTRLTCANFTEIAGGAPAPGTTVLPSSGFAMPTGSKNNSYVAPTATGTGTGPSGTSAPSFTSAAPTQPTGPSPSSPANKLMIAGSGLLAAVMALVL